MSYCSDQAEPQDDGKVAGLLGGNPATAELEELLIGWEYTSRVYGLPLASMPCAATLTVNSMKDILYGEKEHGGVILPTFPNLKLLHLDVFHEDTSSSMALSMARLLRSCPAMSELRLMMWGNYNYELKLEKPQIPSPNPWADSRSSRPRRLHRTASARSRTSPQPWQTTARCSAACGQACGR